MRLTLGLCLCADKYEKEAAKNWDKFYKRNSTNFYKDRCVSSDSSRQCAPSRVPDSSCLLQALSAHRVPRAR